jgi:alpha-L-fucosidase 2
VRLWYDQPARDWETEALPIGNGTLGAMVFGGVPAERLQLNEKTLWTGGPGSEEGAPLTAIHGSGALSATGGTPGRLAELRRRIDALGALPPEQVARALGRPRLGYGAYQHLADLLLDLPADAPVTGYRRQLDLTEAVATVVYRAGGVTYHREYFASYPDRVVVCRLWTDRPGAVTAAVRLVRPAGAKLTVSRPT